MTNSTQSQWEVAGSKKVKGYDSDSKRTSGMTTRNSKSNLPSKIPVVETLQPLKLENGKYDSLQIEDDEDMKKEKPRTPRVEGRTPKSEQKKVPVSPKAKKEEPINLLKANIESKPKKSAKNQLSPGKSVKSELESTLSRLDFDQFQQKCTQLEGLFPDNISLIVMHMAAFLNQSLNDIPDLEPNQNHENESSNYPTCKLEKKLEKFLNNLVSKLKKSDYEYVFDYCLNEIIKNENPRVLSNHGLRIFIQLLVKHNNTISLMSLRKTAELIYANRHKHQRINLALWALSQIGFHDLANGMTIWFEVMFPLIGMKQFQTYITSYLPALFDHHKMDTKSIVSQYKNKYIISLDQYLKVYELSSDRSLNVFVNKDNVTKFKVVFQMIRALFISNLEFSPEACLIFETLLTTLTAETSPKQTEFLELLASCLFSNTDCMNAWRVLYSKNVCQTMILIDFLLVNYKSKFQSLTNMRETLVQFEAETSTTIKSKTAQQPSEETTSKKPYYLQKKAQKTTNNLLELEKLNILVKTTLKQHFKRVSFISIMFRAFFYFVLFSAAFYYWDATQNKSLYFKAGQKQLDKYGVLDDVTRAVNFGKKTYFDAQKAVNHHVPIWYKKTSDVVLPYTRAAWKTTRDYSKLAWKNSENFRTNATAYAQQAFVAAKVYYGQASSQVQIYFNQANDYVQENFPAAKKTALEYFDLLVKYSVKTGDAAVKYTNQAVNYTGTQLLGWKKGDLELVIFELYKETNQVFQNFLQWVNKSIKNLHAQMQ